MEYDIDNVDERIIYRLTENARDTSAPEMAAELDVSASTIRNRIDRMEDAGVLTGYHANVDYEKCGNRLTGLFECTTSVSEQQHLARRALRIPGVVNVREILSGRGNLHVKVIADDTDGFTRIARKLTNLGLEIEDEEFLQTEYVHPYHEFGPESDGDEPPPALETTRNDTVVTVDAAAPIAGRTLKDANRDGLVGEDVLVVAVERDGTVIAPKGDTRLVADDRVKLFSPDAIPTRTLDAFERQE